MGPIQSKLYTVRKKVQNYIEKNVNPTHNIPGMKDVVRFRNSGDPPTCWFMLNVASSVMFQLMSNSNHIESRVD